MNVFLLQYHFYILPFCFFLVVWLIFLILTLAEIAGPCREGLPIASHTNRLGNGGRYSLSSCLNKFRMPGPGDRTRDPTGGTQWLSETLTS